MLFITITFITMTPQKTPLHNRHTSPGETNQVIICYYRVEQWRAPLMAHNITESRIAQLPVHAIQGNIRTIYVIKKITNRKTWKINRVPVWHTNVRKRITSLTEQSWHFDSLLSNCSKNGNPIISRQAPYLTSRKPSVNSNLQRQTPFSLDAQNPYLFVRMSCLKSELINITQMFIQVANNNKRDLFIHSYVGNDGGKFNLLSTRLWTHPVGGNQEFQINKHHLGECIYFTHRAYDAITIKMKDLLCNRNNK